MLKSRWRPRLGAADRGRALLHRYTPGSIDNDPRQQWNNRVVCVIDVICALCSALCSVRIAVVPVAYEPRTISRLSLSASGIYHSHSSVPDLRFVRLQKTDS